MGNYNLTADSTIFTADSTVFTADANPFAFPVSITAVIGDYLGKITPWQANPTKARFLETVRANIQPYVDSLSTINGFPEAYDLEYAVGVQLDVDGEFIGRDRFVPIPIPDLTIALGIFGRGLGQGYWRTNYDSQDNIASLPDALYRPLLRAKIASNSWDGTAKGIVRIIRSYLSDPATFIFVDDKSRAITPHPRNQVFSLGIPYAGLGQAPWKGKMEYPSTPERMEISYVVGISGKLPSRVDLYILANDLIPIKGMGANVRFAVTTVDQTPVFGLGMNDGRVAGLGIGSWGADPATVAASLPV